MFTNLEILLGCALIATIIFNVVGGVNKSANLIKVENWDED